VTYEELIAYYGTQKAAADALGLSQPSLDGWKKGIPPPRQAQYELLTSGALQADRPIARERAA